MISQTQRRRLNENCPISNAYLVSRLLALAGLALIVASSVAFSQGIITGSISGSVTDPTGVAIPNKIMSTVILPRLLAAHGGKSLAAK